jgi:hypothetical protein
MIGGQSEYGSEHRQFTVRRQMMLRKLQMATILLCLSSYMAGETASIASIGTVNARGGLRVDGNDVMGNATLFNGSTIETSRASATLRLSAGAEVTLASDSHGTLYRDHLVLKKGKGELAGSSPFQLQAMGLHVSGNSAGSRGVVSVVSDGRIEVTALAGNLGVVNAQGIVLANLQPGRSMAFAMQGQGTPTSFSGTGIVSVENGRYYLSADNNVTYELVGKNLQKYVGTKVVVSGNLQPAAAGGAGGVIGVKSIAINGGGAVGLTTTELVIIGGVSAGLAATLGWVVYDATQNPASP